MSKETVIIDLGELQNECERMFQSLCEKAKLGGAATLDELADVAGLLVGVAAAIRALKGREGQI